MTACRRQHSLLLTAKLFVPKEDKTKCVSWRAFYRSSIEQGPGGKRESRKHGRKSGKNARRPLWVNKGHF